MFLTTLLSGKASIRFRTSAYGTACLRTPGSRVCRLVCVRLCLNHGHCPVQRTASPLKAITGHPPGSTHMTPSHREKQAGHRRHHKLCLLLLARKFHEKLISIQHNSLILHHHTSKYFQILSTQLKIILNMGPRIKHTSAYLVHHCQSYGVLGDFFYNLAFFLYVLFTIYFLM